MHRHTQKVHLYAQPTMSMGRSTEYTVLSSGDTVAPAMGRVHLVGMGNYADPNQHFLSQMDARQKGIEKAGPVQGPARRLLRHGPFAAHLGQAAG